ncbi:MAG: amino acid adenylation domain-containing protein [Rhizonema sp. PD37]|nr:amino acid adenylation domain-containing protein [Rhizonema sp. PD37]
MKPIKEFLSYLCSLDVKIWAEGDRLRCNAPKGKLTLDLQDQLVKRKVEILTFLNQTNLAFHTTVEPIGPIARDGPIPLSFAQQRLWFLDKLEGESATYNIPIALHLIGELQVAALEMAILEIVQRHEVLRTTFKMVNGIPVQLIAPTATFTMPIVDLQGLPKEEQSAVVQLLATQFEQQPFDLDNGPLLRATLLVLCRELNVLLITIHHIVFDGWSTGILFQELSLLYKAFCTGKSSPLPKLPLQYADFASWQRQWLSRGTLDTQLQYWQQQLAGIPPVLELPTDYLRPPVQTFRGNTETFILNQKLTQQLKSLSQKSGTTLFMTLLAAFVTLLYRYSGQEDIVVGSPIANRPRHEIESLIGFFVNTLVVRTQLKGNPSFEELLARVRQVALDAYAHQDVPFEQVVEALQPERSVSHSPLFQVVFVFQNMPPKKLELPGLTITSLESKGVTAKFDLTLSMSETEEGLLGVWEYNSYLFDAITMKRMVKQFQTMFAAIVTNPQQRLTELPLLTEAERYQLLVEWNNTQTNYPQDKCIHQLFEEQVEQTPDAVAVVFEGEQLTYQELNCRANQIAHYLRSVGVGADELVGICLERSPLMVIGLLGILKAGGAYVPLDPEYPQERLAYTVADACASVLITQQELTNVLSLGASKLVCLDTDWSEIAHHSQDNPVNEVKADNLAYVIYTSGSTGRPKGVAIQHQSPVALVEWASTVFTISELAGVLFSTSICFDLSVFELFVPLSCGGKVILAENALHLPQLPEVNNVTLINAVPSAIAELLRMNGVPASVSTVNLAGEALANQLVQQIYQHNHIQKVFNLYGPTEDTTYSTFALALKGHSNAPPIGRPIANTQIYILDTDAQPVPIGVSGELHISGVGLARGYLNQPELTAVRFIPNPFNPNPRSRLYKTGDLARYLPDGNIEYLGRLDHQVKVRGFRIELGEIESRIAQHPNVRQTVVVARAEETGAQRLVAYIVPKAQPVPSISEWRSFLIQQLPEYMLPSAFVILDALPLTPNGKVDRRALRKPDILESLETSFVAPRDLLELQLAKIWENVLNVSPIGVRSNFFELGGHSLLAIRLIAQIEQQCRKTLPLATLLQSPTIEDLASILRGSLDSQPTSCLVAIQPVGKKAPFFCIHPVGGHVFCYANLAHHLGLEQPFYGLQSLGLNDEQEPFTRIEDTATHYIEVLQTIQPQGPYYLGGWSLGGAIAFEMARKLQTLGHEVALLALIDSYAPKAMNKPKEIDEATLLAFIGSDLGGLFGKKLSICVDELQQLHPKEQLNHILEQAKMLDILPPEVGIQQMHRVLKVFKANLQALYHYTPQPYSGRIILFRACEQVVEVTPHPTRGWGELAAGGIETHNIPGDHYAIVQEPHVQILAEVLKAHL